MGRVSLIIDLADVAAKMNRDQLYLVLIEILRRIPMRHLKVLQAKYEQIQSER